MFCPPAFLLRQKMILKKLKDCGAISEESAKTLEEAGVFNPKAFPKATEDLVNKKKLAKAQAQKYYLVHGTVPRKNPKSYLPLIRTE